MLSIESIYNVEVNNYIYHPGFPGSARSLSSVHSISTESRLSRGGAAAAAHSISTASVVTDRSGLSAGGSASSVATDSGARPSSPPSKSDSIAEELHSEKGGYYNEC